MRSDSGQKKRAAAHKKIDNFSAVQYDIFVETGENDWA